jgi:hypothetical protein
LERGKKKTKARGKSTQPKKNGPIKSHKKAQIKLGTPFTKGVGKISTQRKNKSLIGGGGIILKIKRHKNGQKKLQRVSAKASAHPRNRKKHSLAGRGKGKKKKRQTTQ